MTLFSDLSGPIRDADDALIPATDSVVTHGDGVFETVLVVDGRPLDLAKHQARLAFSATILGLDTPGADQWAGAIAALIDEFRRRGTDPAGDECVLRLTSTGSGRHFATVGAVPDRVVRARAGISVIVAADPFVRDAPFATTMAKTLSYATNLAALRYAREHGADDVIFLAPNGTVTESPTATVVLARRGELITPDSWGLLPPITAARLGARPTPVTAQDLATADGVYLVSALRLAAPVVTLDGAPRTHDAELTEQIRRRLVE